MWPFKKKTIADIEHQLTREQIISRSRILIIDDEEPGIIEDLRASHFHVEYVKDITPRSLDIFNSVNYDLILLDFSGVGRTVGIDEGLSILKHIKRVNKSALVLAYTSKALYARQAEFYTLSDGFLSKDAGIQESLEKIEEALSIARSIRHLWSSFLATRGIQQGSAEDSNLQHEFVSALESKEGITRFRRQIGAGIGEESMKAISAMVIEKIVEVAVLSACGA